MILPARHRESSGLLSSWSCVTDGSTYSHQWLFWEERLVKSSPFQVAARWMQTQATMVGRCSRQKVVSRRLCTSVWMVGSRYDAFAEPHVCYCEQASSIYLMQLHRTLTNLYIHIYMTQNMHKKLYTKLMYTSMSPGTNIHACLYTCIYSKKSLRVISHHNDNNIMPPSK